ncbi:hypothetical protein F385_3361 [Pantoea agglomerans 299R]|nr:hypothetical protein F385_3361 [Pantoea agglomerans 299R]
MPKHSAGISGDQVRFKENRQRSPALDASILCKGLITDE